MLKLSDWSEKSTMDRVTVIKKHVTKVNIHGLVTAISRQDGRKLFDAQYVGIEIIEYTDRVATMICVQLKRYRNGKLRKNVAIERCHQSAAYLKDYIVDKVKDLDELVVDAVNQYFEDEAREEKYLV